MSFWEIKYDPSERQHGSVVEFFESVARGNRFNSWHSQVNVNYLLSPLLSMICGTSEINDKDLSVSSSALLHPLPWTSLDLPWCIIGNGKFNIELCCLATKPKSKPITNNTYLWYHEISIWHQSYSIVRFYHHFILHPFHYRRRVSPRRLTF